MKRFILVLMLLSFNTFATKVNINTADAQVIADSLSGIGIIKAQEIVKHRKTVGKFKSLADFIQVKGIGEKTVAKNKQDILFKADSLSGISIIKTQEIVKHRKTVGKFKSLANPVQVKSIEEKTAAKNK